MVGAEACTSFERSVMLQSLDTPLARAPGGAGSSAPGHPPARLCAEKPEAGIQARSVRTVLPMLDRIKAEVTQIVMTVRIQSREEIDAAEQEMAQSQVENVH